MKLWHQETSSVTTFDELRLGLSYAAVAPDPLIPITPHPSFLHRHLPRHRSLTLPTANHTPLTFTPSLATLIPTATLDLSWHTSTPDYHLYDDAETNSFDSHPRRAVNDLVLAI